MNFVECKFCPGFVLLVLLLKDGTAWRLTQLRAERLKGSTSKDETDVKIKHALGFVQYTCGVILL
jgi:hypothetical protein